AAGDRDALLSDSSRALLSRASVSRLGPLVRATHAPPSAAVTTLVTVTALAAGVGVRSLLLGAAILCGQASIGWANDYVDADRDRLVRRRDKPVATGEIAASIV